MSTGSTPQTGLQAQQGGELGAANMYGDEFVHTLQAALDANTYSGEILYSRVCIMQPGSPEIAQNVPGYKSGQLVDNVTREILTSFVIPPWLIAKGVKEEEINGKYNCCRIVPIFKLPTEFVKWKNRDTEGNGFHWKTLDRTDQRVREGLWSRSGGTYRGEGAPPVTENCNFLCAVLGVGGEMDGLPICNFIIFTFSRTSAKCGQKLTSSLQAHPMLGLLPWQLTYWIYMNQGRNEEKNSTFYYMDLAKGPRLNNVNLDRMCAATARVLSDPTPSQSPPIPGLGKMTVGLDLQINMINAAQLMDENEYAPSDSASDVFGDGAVTGTATAATAATATSPVEGGSTDPDATPF